MAGGEWGVGGCPSLTPGKAAHMLGSGGSTEPASLLFPAGRLVALLDKAGGLWPQADRTNSSPGEK